MDNRAKFTRCCAKLVLRINRFSEFTGRLTAWLVIALVALIFYDVTMRYLFNSGSVALQELEWHFFAVIILFGAGYTLKHGDHVRVDIIYASKRLSDRHRLIIDIVGNLLFLIPFATLIIWNATPFAYQAFIQGEISPDPGGLSHRWILKAAIPVGFGLLALQGVADTIEKLLELSDDV
ncbi:MAG: TRAP transporter small permease subunit [Proteobacteria bacterium]|nr:MAG: TRAP transporter small permease subunit [Pseudomonadota bacterium]